MKTKLLLLALLLTSYWVAAQQTVELNNNKPLTWQGKAAMGGYAPEGTLDVEKAVITIENGQITALVVAVDMKTLSQENKRLEKHLRNEDFFDVKVFPQAVFTLTDPVDLANGTCKLQGVMSIKNKAVSEEIPAWINITDQLITITFDAQLDRTAYWITYNSPSFFTKLKDQAIADEFTLKGKLSLPNRF